VFTGLVQGLGRIESAERSEDGVRLTVSTELASELAAGDSVAVNGVCLTASAAGPQRFTAEVVNETLHRSSLGRAEPGAHVNLELPLRASDRLGGHVVQGHVDAVGTIVGVTPDGFSRRIEVEAPADVLRYVVRKGSVAVDGVSLTIAEIGPRSFTVSLIPETIERTSLGRVVVGSTVNLEVDVLAKYVERLMEPAR
jgi:riboflavin synthase